MAVSYTIPNTFAALTVAESAKVNANETYTKSVFDGLEATTKTLAKLKVDVDPTTALEVATKQYVDHYSTWRRPSLQWSSVTTVAVESGLDGTSGNIPMLFPDGSVRTETSTTRTTFNITRNAVLTTSGAQSGLRTGLSEQSNQWLALYAVKVTDSSTQWCTVGDTVLPLQANYSTLNSNFGTSGWVYLGLIRNGDGDASGSDIVRFTQAGHFTKFYNRQNSADTSSGQEAHGVAFASTSSATTLTWTYAAGTSGAQLPANITIAMWQSAQQNTTNKTNYYNTGLTTLFAAHPASLGALALPPVIIPASEGVGVGTFSAAIAADIFLVGFYDNVLGVGSHPLI